VSLANRLASEKEQLNALLGRDIGTPLEIVAPLPAPAFSRDREDVRAQALASRPDVRQARVRIDQSVLAERIARADRLPDIALAVNYLSPLIIDGAPTNLASVGVQMTWEPFDWGRKSRVVATRALERRQAELALADAERHALADVHAAHRTLDEAQAALRVARLAQESAREQARVAAAQYQAEAVLLSQVLNTESAVAESNHRYREALSTYWTARAALGRSLGEE
jgi:outer membrane protein TolC